MVAAQQDFSAEQRTIISGAFEIADRILREILVPRRDVLTLPTGTARARGAAPADRRRPLARAGGRPGRAWTT